MDGRKMFLPTILLPFVLLPPMFLPFLLPLKVDVQGKVRFDGVVGDAAEGEGVLPGLPHDGTGMRYVEAHPM